MALFQSRFTFGPFVIEGAVPGAFFGLSSKQNTDQMFTFSQPVVEINGQERTDFKFSYVLGQRTHPRGWEDFEMGFISQGEPDIYLRLIFRRYFNAPILRVRYRLTAKVPCELTKTGGLDNLPYFGLEFPAEARGGLTEINLSHFEPVLHSYLPGIEFYDLDDTFEGQEFPGPIMVYEDEFNAILLAYEHGADSPNSFLRYTLEEVDGHARLSLRARQGNYLNGHPIGPDRSFDTVWFEIGWMFGGLSDILPRYREYLLKEMSPNIATRQPTICYNTWNYQERNKLYNGRPYLESMNLERMLAEIEVANRMGVDIFVIDTGWFTRPGDWSIDLARFPDGLKQVKRKLEQYGMQLGLWFNPQAAGLASQVYREHPEWEMSWQDKPHAHWVVWETEESTAMCLASDFADTFADVMIRFREELGVTYFKWDGIGQTGCDSPLHHHGTAAHPPEERAAAYAYQMGLHLIHIIEKVTARFEDVIVDFDATEAGRFVGLGLLGVARFFLINNGSYARDFDTPEQLGLNPYMNMFFYPGPARPRVCRRASLFDAVVPSNLMLVHYLPDGPQVSLDNSLASLVLGGNGLWGDLPALSEEVVRFWRDNLADYKRV
ncbi:MAG TPA: alpha-galactosidase, partial [Anaerolinea sp.]|nr:alpha-galactosidase [Anaerolinea sp.]